MLDNVGGSFPGNDAASDVELEPVFADFRLRQFGPDERIDLSVGASGRCVDGGGARRCRGGGSSRKRAEQCDKNEGE